MVAREMIEIILKAEDQASKVFKENEENMKRFGDTAKQANQKASQASQQYSQKLEETKKKLPEMSKHLNDVGRNGSQSFNQLSKSQQDSIVKFNMLDKETQEVLQQMSRMKGLSSDLVPGASKALQEFNSLDHITETWAGSIEYAKSKVNLLGNSTDGLRGKIQVVGNAIPTYLGTKWDGLKSKVSSFGNFIKSHLTSALSTVRSKIESLGNAFSGLGGVISSVIGGIGLKEFSDMTLGASVTRDRIHSLSNALLNADTAMVKLNGTSVSLWDKMDADTNKSLVSLDQIAQSLSVVKQMTNANADEVAAFEPVLMDIGQRAILMGKNGEEAMGVMQAAGKGLNGEFETLKENFGITRDKLEDMGWDGTAEDIEGYTKALQEALSQSGDVSDMMDTTYGKLTSVQTMWKVAGRSLGDDFKPYLDSALDSLRNFLDANHDGALDESSKMWLKYAYGVMGVGSAFATAAPTIAPMLSVMDTLHGTTGKVINLFGESKVFTNFFSTLAGGQGVIAAITAGYDAMAISEYIALAPLLAIIAALALLAVAVYEVGKYFGWWKDIPTLFEAITTNVGRLWDAFINNPDVQGLIKGIGDTWNWLLEVTKPVVDWLSGIWVEIFPESAQGQWDVTRAIIEAIGLAFTSLTIPIRTLIEILQILYPYVEQFYTGTLVPLGEFLTTVFTPVWQLLVNIISAVTPIVMNVINAFDLFANGQIGLPDLILTVLTSLFNMYTTILGQIVQAVIKWASQIVSKGISGASRFVSGIIRYISSLPGRFGAYLINIIDRIASAGASWVSTGISKASAMVTGIMSNISQLPEKVYTEFMNIGSRMLSAGSDLVNKAKNIGKNIVDGLLGAMGIHSPGIIQEKVVLEFVNMIGRVGSKIKSAYDTAKSMGEAIVEGFGNPTLETDVSNAIPDMSEINTQIGVQKELVQPDENTTTASVDTSGVTAGNTDVIGSYDQLATMTGTALQSMVDRDKLAYDTMRNNDANTLSQMSTNLSMKMGQMTSNVNSNMNNIVAKNRSSMTNVNNTTKSHLNSIVSKTKSANNQMIKSWGVMKDGIISAANKIKSDSTTHFNKLSDTIGSFYGKLKNPSRWGAGSPITRTHNTSSNGNGFSKITNAIRAAQLPKYLSLGQIHNNPLIQAGKFGDYVTRDKRNNMFNVNDLLSYGALKIIGKGAGAYSDIPSPNVKLIKDTSNEWDMKGPLVGKYQTNKGFKVKEFLTGVPKIGFDVFRGIAEDVFSQTNYEFYYDDDHHGNWVNAFNAGSMNCKHGAEAIIALAQTMGLSGSMVHGHWTDSSGTYGHYFANIAGHKMDVTGWQQRRTWTPSASAGPAPHSIGFKDLIQQVIDILKDDPKNTPGNNGLENNSEDNTLKGEFTFIHDFKNLPDGITAEEVAALIEKSTTNDTFIKKLAQNPVFQKWDLKTKNVLENKNNRARGV